MSNRDDEVRKPRSTRSRLIEALLQVVILLLPHSLSAGAQAAPHSMTKVVDVSGVSMTVSDLDKAVEFYTHVLGFIVKSTSEIEGPDFERLYGVFALHARIARLSLGEEQIELMEYLSPRGRIFPSDSRSNDRWFQHIAIVTSDMQKAYAQLRSFHVEHASSSPQQLPDWNPAARGIKAFYFKDPDGHPLEILEFPENKGFARWHQKTGQLFLGIDHTAIVVGDTEASLRFYRDLLGLRVAGESENYGTEQEHLNSVFGARLHITTLRPASGPGVELLEYLTPRDGRPFPADEKANDIVHRHTLFKVADLGTLEKNFRDYRTTLISPGTQTVESETRKKSILVRDPDGHSIEATER